MRVGELLRLLLRRAKVGDRRIALEIYPVTTSDMVMPQSRSRSEAPNWLPGQVFEQQYYTPVLNPRTGAPLAVPALVVPEYDEFVRVR